MTKGDLYEHLENWKEYGKKLDRDIDEVSRFRMASCEKSVSVLASSAIKWYS
jgi:hypothetical protein